MAHCKAPMRAIFILVFTAVQADAVAPRGLATPPDITQRVRRVVRRLGRRMGMSIKTRRATNSDKTDDDDGVAVQPHVQTSERLFCAGPADLPVSLQEECGAVLCDDIDNLDGITCPDLVKKYEACLPAIADTFSDGSGNIASPAWLERGGVAASILRVLPAGEWKKDIDRFAAADKDQACEEAKKEALSTRMFGWINVAASMKALYAFYGDGALTRIDPAMQKLMIEAVCEMMFLKVWSEEDPDAEACEKGGKSHGIDGKDVKWAF